MSFLTERCSFYPLNEEVIKSCEPFSCGHNDLDDFFNKESHLYAEQLLGKSYCFRLDDDPSIITCAFTVANSSIKVSDLPNSRQKKVRSNIPHSKHSDTYPAVLIGRLGVSKQFKGQGIGNELMSFIKMWFLDPHNKTGCRFVVVDAYNDQTVLDYYLKNDFQFLFSSEDQELAYSRNRISTRLMLFDLILIK